MATKKGTSPDKKAPTSKGAQSYSPGPNERGACTQPSAGGLNKPVANAEQGTGSGQR